MLQLVVAEHVELPVAAEHVELPVAAEHVELPVAQAELRAVQDVQPQEECE